MRDVRVAAAQITSGVGALEVNVGKHQEYARRAAAAGAQVVCFPELSLCGYPTGPSLPDGLAQPLDGELSQAMLALSRQTGVVVLAGLLERDRSGVVYNTQIVAAPDGPIGAYRKVHVPTSEICRFYHGDDLPVFALPWATVGVQICYDSHFPEGSTIQALQGAEIIFLPHASTGGAGGESYAEKRARWLRYMPARAYDNRLYVVVVNQVGHNGVAEFPGVAFALDPDGNTIAESRADVEDLMVVDLSASALERRRRSAEGFFAHFRRPEAYGLIDRPSRAVFGR
jgi:N-carbamoylputrescine amidase